jgi:hypothetical protein
VAQALLYDSIMLYRKAPPRPSRLLLQIVTASGTGVLLGTMACSASPGLITDVPAGDDGGDAQTTGPCGNDPCGVAPAPPETGDAGDAGDAGEIHPCGGGPCGSVAVPPDAGDAGDGSVGIGPCGGGPCGVVAIPQDASDDAAHTGPCGGGPCGVVVLLDAGTDQ